MKKSRIKYFTLVAILPVLIACQNPFQEPSSEPPNTGYFSLAPREVSLGRTILPVTTIDDFAAFNLAFFAAGESSPALTVERTKTNLSNPVTLNAGTWSLSVTAYMDTGRTKLVAQGSLAGIVIIPGQTFTGGVKLEAIILADGAASGTFSWKIDYPTGVNKAGMTITPFDTIKGTPEQTLYFIGGTPQISRDSSRTLNPGYYRVTFNLSRNNGLQNAVRREILHIYQNMESAFAFTFDDSHFHQTFIVTSNADSGPGSLRQAITDAPYNSTITIADNVGTIALKERLAIDQILTIEGNGVIITRDASWTTVNSNSQLLYILYGYTVTIRRIHFKDGRGTSLGGAIYNIGNLTVESCIFSGNRSDSIGGAIHNNS
jgi:hypothetical protein